MLKNLPGPHAAVSANSSCSTDGVLLKDGVRSGSERFATADTLAGKSPHNLLGRSASSRKSLVGSPAVTARVWPAQGPKEDMSGNVQEKDELSREWLQEWSTAEPKRPPSAYFLWVAECGKNHDGEAGNKGASELCKQWRNMDQIERSSFTDRERRLQAQYQEELAEFREKGRYRVRTWTTKRR